MLFASLCRRIVLNSPAPAPEVGIINTIPYDGCIRRSRFIEDAAFRSVTNDIPQAAVRIKTTGRQHGDACKSRALIEHTIVATIYQSLCREQRRRDQARATLEHLTIAGRRQGHCPCPAAFTAQQRRRSRAGKKRPQSYSLF